MAVCDQRVLPRSIDVTVNVRKPQAALLTDFSKLLVATTDAPYDHGLRLKAYVDIDGVLLDFTSTQEAYKAARDFFAQSPRPTYLLIGKVFTTPQSGFMETRTIVPTVLPSTFAAVSDGEYTISVDGESQDVAAQDFTTATDFDDIAVILTAGVTGATVVFDANSSDNFIFTSSSTGETSTVSALTDTGGTGTDISGLSFLNGLDDPLTETDDLRIVAGYTPVGIVDELSLLENAGQCGGNNWYGLALTKEFRDDASTLDSEFHPRLAAGWIQTQRKQCVFVTNSILSTNPDISSDIGSDLKELDYKRSSAFYGDNAGYYPDVSVLARLQAVDFREREGVITLKFKDLPGIPTSNVTASQLNALLFKRINTFTRIQTDVRTVRDGTTASTSWFMDEVFNIDGLVDAIETEVYNAYLRNGRIPLNPTGRLILEDAINKACFKFTVNGTLTSRESTDAQTGDISTEPAYLIEVPLAGDLSIADRALRKWSGIKVIGNLSGAAHSSTINLDAFV